MINLKIHKPHTSRGRAARAYKSLYTVGSYQDLAGNTTFYQTFFCAAPRFVSFVDLIAEFYLVDRGLRHRPVMH